MLPAGWATRLGRRVVLPIVRLFAKNARTHGSCDAEVIDLRSVIQRRHLVDSCTEIALCPKHLVPRDLATFNTSVAVPANEDKVGEVVGPPFRSRGDMVNFQERNRTAHYRRNTDFRPAGKSVSRSAW